MILLLLCLLATLLSYGLSGLIRNNAVHWGLIDIPNERSSHHTPVPRGGGIAIALVFMLLAPMLQWYWQSSPPLFLAIYGAGSLIAIVGILDDRGHIPAHKRLIIHFVAAFWILYQLDPTVATMSNIDDPLFWAITTGSVLFLVWLLNLYNFMDGIDAISGSETLSVALCAALLSWMLLPDHPTWQLLMLLASSVTGFLIWNLPPARLFMGDAGSAFLGIILGTLAIDAAHHSTQLFTSWLILLGVYLVDATVTLSRRILTGEQFYQAHRTHAYQHAAIRLASHGRVSLGIALINLLWLFPLAAAVALDILSEPLGLLIAYLPLLFLAVHFKAGVRLPPAQADSEI
ncbi:MAG: glycosyltransferase family 4 protein [Candidatus Thiodiazotropha sp. (ex Monitilora ramsayi)]|nr:glycosyltransferase family 4 protein [Candidatus Thiodiazotropha sp. (ex Monitilora ramsayi)]